MRCFFVGQYVACFKDVCIDKLVIHLFNFVDKDTNSMNNMDGSLIHCHYFKKN